MHAKQRTPVAQLAGCAVRTALKFGSSGNLCASSNVQFGGERCIRDPGESQDNGCMFCCGYIQCLMGCFFLLIRFLFDADCFFTDPSGHSE